jgi:hypothetical protein
MMPFRRSVGLAQYDDMGDREGAFGFADEGQCGVHVRQFLK